MSYWYDLDGNAIGMREGSELLADYEARKVAQDVMVVDDQPVYVSTVFLVLNHEWRKNRPPVLWETMVFTHDDQTATWRYTSRLAAKEGHARVVASLAAQGLAALRWA